jgi:dihydrofolate reductase
MQADDKAWFDHAMESMGAVIAGRGTYEAAAHWGDSNPWPIPLFIVTHRPEGEPQDHGFTFVGSIAEASEQARAAAGSKDVHVMGGADVIRQVLVAGLVDQLTIIVAPVILGHGKRLFDGFQHSMELEQIGVRQSQFATFLDYRIKQTIA